MRYQGKITRWKDVQGFGFITPNGGGELVFLHIKAFTRRDRRPSLGEIVTYTLATDATGRARAENVAFVVASVPAASDRSSRGKGVSPLLAVLFLLSVTASAVFGKLPPALAGLYAVASLLAFVMYAWDKSAAVSGRWRTQESTLLLIGLVGGWPGALLAQKVLRHKSRKRSFQVIFWATVLINIGILGWLLTAKGAAVMWTLLAGGA